MSLGSSRLGPWPGRLTSLEGGIVAEGVDASGFELGLVALDDQEIIATALADRRCQRPMREGGVAGDDRAVERQVLQEPEGLDHLATVGRNGE